jgi:hypothetical protein
MTYEELLNTTIYLTTKASSQNAYHEWTYTYTDAATATRCRMVPIRIAERITAPGLYDDVSYACFTLSSSSIDRDSRVKYGDKYYRVKEMERDSSFHHKKSLLVEVP